MYGCKRKGTKPQSAGSLSTVVLLQSVLPKVIRNRRSILIQNNFTIISKGQLLHRSTVSKLPDDTPPNMKKVTDVGKAAKKTQMGLCETHGLYFRPHSPLQCWRTLHHVKEEKKKSRDKKLTFTTLVSHKPRAAPPLQCSDLLVGNLEGGSDQGPVAVENSTRSLISGTFIVAA